MTLLIDVSKHQGNINWNKVASELRRVNGGNPGGVIIRIGYSRYAGGLNLDTHFTRNADGCEKYNIPYGVYFYSYDQSVEAIKKSALDVVNLIGTRKLQYPVYVDIEYEAFNLSCGKQFNTDMFKAACTVLEQHGFYAGCYASRDFFLNYTNLSQLKNYTLWEAAYTGSDSTAVNNDMWQYSSKNALGIEGFGASLDCNKCYKDFPSIIKRAGLNNFTKYTEPEQVDWNSVNDWFKVQCSKGDRTYLKKCCEDHGLPVYNLY